jgi:hypothetical protein
MDGRMNEWMERWMVGWIDGWLDDEYMIRWWIDGLMYI